MKEKIVLAFSGGLDTSFCTVYLGKEKDYEVHTVIVNTGGFDDSELKVIEEKAMQYGSARHTVIDARQEYYDRCIRYLVYGNVLRNRNYPVSVSSERTFQSLKIVEYARSQGITAMAHGSTGAGNDQVRFESVFQIIAPEIDVMAPIRDLSISREEEIAYLSEHGFTYKAEKKDYSINKGLWGTSVGGRETLTSHMELPEEAYLDQVEKQGSEIVTLGFERGEAVSLNGHDYKNRVGLIHDLERLASKYAVGRDMHIGETIIGIKGRIGFQAAAARLIIDAHYTLEKHVLSKWQQHWKEQLGNWYGMFVHEAQFLDPVMRDIEAFLDHSQRYVSGKVTIRLRPYSYLVTGIESKHDLMNPQFAKYGEENLSWDGNDVKGFTKIMSNPARIFYSINSEEKTNLF
ncbi:MAG TPA: argininosuccinate synthase [Bacteroidales bacterium]|nr:argininosuccinate synthase [Bacteroidales bacterium]